MKPRAITYSIVAALMVLTLLWRFSERAEPIVNSAKRQQNAKELKAPVKTSNNDKGSGLNDPITAGVQKEIREINAEARRNEQWKHAVNGQNLPVQFFGKVVDQNTNPIPGVTVAMRLRHSDYSAVTGVFSSYPAKTVETDAYGYFQWVDLNATGDTLGIDRIAKEGYRLSPKLGAIAYPPAAGTREQPISFKMWKLHERAKLVTGSKFWHIIPDGRIYTLDLLQGTESESPNATGDLRVSVSRPQSVSRKETYDWQLHIQAINGGIILAQDEFMYEAPESGYSQVFDLQFEKSNQQWTDHPKKDFYIRTRSGQVYGRINAEIFARYQDAGVLSIDYALNPLGSNNLQP